MLHRWLPAAILSVATGGPVFADVAPFRLAPPIDIRVRFENLDDFPKYDFYLKYGFARGNPNSDMHKIKVETNVWIQLAGNSWDHMGNVSLLAVPRDLGANPPPDPDANTLESDSIAGGAVGLLGGQFNGHQIDYRVRIEDGRLDVLWVKSKTPWLPQTEMGRLRFLCTGFTLGAILVVTAIAVRRRRRNSIAPSFARRNAS